MGKVKDNAEHRATLQSILFSGKEITFDPYNNSFVDARAYGFIINDNGIVKIANKIFELLFRNYLFASSQTDNSSIYEDTRPVMLRLHTVQPNDRDLLWNIFQKYM